MSGQRLEPSNAEVVRHLIEISSKLDLLITSAKEGGGLVPQVSYMILKKLRKRVVKHGYRIKCKKQCRRGPCRYGASQALQCLEQFEKIAKLIKKRGEGNRPIIDGILKNQDRYIKLRDKARKKKEVRDRLRAATIRAQEEVERHQETTETEIKINGPK